MFFFQKKITIFKLDYVIFGINNPCNIFIYVSSFGAVDRIPRVEIFLRYNRILQKDTLSIGSTPLCHFARNTVVTL